MAYAIGVALFAVGILVSVILHEAGHFYSARAFGMKVTQFFVGFGPSLWSFRRGETEYGVKAIPAGAFVKIVGMTPQDDDSTPEEAHRAMWRYPVWKRSIVMAAGSVVHFVLGFVILWAVFAFVPLNDFERLDSAAPQVAQVSGCTVLEWEVDPETGAMRECVPGEDPRSAAAQAGLARGDVITAFDGEPVAEWGTLTERIRAAGGETVTLTYERGDAERTVEVALPLAERVREDVSGVRADEVTDAHLEQIGVLGITPQIPQTTYGPVGGVGMAGEQTATMFTGTVEALSQLPQRIPALWEAAFGGERDPETPMSLVGASHVGGSLWDRGEAPAFLTVLAALNFFIGVFNLLPLLPLDGGHLAVAWFSKARSWVYARLGKPDPGLLDYYKLMPLTYLVILVMAGFFLLTLTADIVSPLQLPL